MYRTVDARFWSDPKVRRWGPDERLLFLYLITNPHTHLSGLYYLPWALVPVESGLTDGRAKYCLAILMEDGVVNAVFLDGQVKTVNRVDSWRYCAPDGQELSPLSE